MGRSEKKKQGRGGDPRRPRHGGAALRQRLYAKDWVVYCKPPFAGPDAVYAYLGRYTHRIGLSNRRLLHVTDERVTFATRHDKRASLAPRIFLRRFLEHVLPPGFVRIRHYGLLASAHVHAGLARARAALEPAPVSEPATEPDADAEDDDDALLVETVRRLCGLDLRRCPACAHRAMQLGAAPLPRGPPC